MSESLQHQQLVKQILNYTINLVGEDKKSQIATDTANSTIAPPLTQEGYRPDLYYNSGEMLIIGEAKTSDDIEREHSRKQYESYIRKCSLFPGQSILVFAVPWMDHATLHNIVTRIRKHYPGTYTIKILDGIGGAI